MNVLHDEGVIHVGKSQCTGNDTKPPLEEREDVSVLKSQDHEMSSIGDQDQKNPVEIHKGEHMDTKIEVQTLSESIEMVDVSKMRQ